MKRERLTSSGGSGSVHPLIGNHPRELHLAGMLCTELSVLSAAGPGVCQRRRNKRKIENNLYYGRAACPVAQAPKRTANQVRISLRPKWRIGAPKAGTSRPALPFLGNLSLIFFKNFPWWLAALVFPRYPLGMRPGFAPVQKIKFRPVLQIALSTAVIPRPGRPHTRIRTPTASY